MIKTPQTTPHEIVETRIRWLIRRDMPEVLFIERQSFEFPWSADDFLRMLRKRCCIGIVAERGQQVAGYAIYTLKKHQILLDNLAVDLVHRNQNVGRKIIEHLIKKLSYKGRRRIQAYVAETSLAAQLFFRSLGFRAVAIVRGFYSENNCDAYLFEYKIKNPCEESR